MCMLKKTYEFLGYLGKVQVRKLSYINSRRQIHTQMIPNQKYTILADSSNIEKPLLDDRLYRMVKINKNDLVVLLINDSSCDKAAAAMDVNVGSFADKDYGISGLAHFCEHLLFMGTKKYPEENEYSSYLSKHGGYSNAYTSSEHTNYFFELSSEYLEGALDRFAQFFIEPLFSVSCKDREIKAVDSENKKNLQNDLWRFYQLDKLTSNQAHPYSGFSTGNYHTLHELPAEAGLDEREVLIEFYKNHYSANLMSLVILGKEGLDTLTNFAIEKFSDIPNPFYERPNYSETLIYGPEHLGKLIKAKPIRDANTLELSFMIPDDQESNWECKPAGYYSHLLGHESSGSLLFYLKKKGWANEIAAGGMKVSQGNSVFSVVLDMTPEGVKNWETIVVHVFEYIKLVVNEGPHFWLWDELRKMATINFQFRQKMDSSSTVLRLSSQLYKYVPEGYIPPQHLLDSGILAHFDKNQIQKYGKYLIKNNFRILLASPSLEDVDQKEKWYGTSYSYQDIPNSLLQSLGSIKLNDNFHLPHPNEFIPSQFSILGKKSESPLTHPYLIKDNEKVQVWFKQDDRFEVPKGSIEVFLHLPNTIRDCKTSLYSTLYNELLNDDLNELVYYAALGSLSFSIDRMRDGFLLKVSGYSDKAQLCLEKILTRMKNVTFKKDRFDIVKYKLYQDYKNFGLEVPYLQVRTHLTTFLNEKTYPVDDKLALLSGELNYEDFLEFVDGTLWKLGVFSEILIHGNFLSRNALSISSAIEDFFQDTDKISSDKKEIEEITKQRSYIVPPGGCVRHEVTLKDKDNVNSCIEYFIQIGDLYNDRRLKVLTNLLATIIQEPSFDQLRTKEQLGYVVFAGLRLTRTAFGLRILIQSEWLTAYLEYRIQEFLARFIDFILSEFDESAFDLFKRALKVKKLMKLKNIREESERLWGAIINGYYDFNEREKDVEILETITIDELKNYVKDFFSKDSKKTSKVILHLKSQCVPAVGYEKMVHAAVNNFLYRYKLLEVPELKQLVDQSIYQPDLLVYNIGTVMRKNGLRISTAQEEELVETLKNGLDRQILASFPQGELHTIETFKKKFPTGDIPRPVQPVSDFYLPQLEENFHL